MRINQFVALATGLSRRSADSAISSGRVSINGLVAQLGQTVGNGDQVCLDDSPIQIQPHRYFMLNKPVGYLTSRVSQGGSPTIYKLLPKIMHELKPVGRLDKDSSGLLLLTNNGELANQLTHPKYRHSKQYIVSLNKPLGDTDRHKLITGVQLEDGPSKFESEPVKLKANTYNLTLSEGRNRQIRRSFKALGYTVVSLQRLAMGKLKLANLPVGDYRELRREEII